MNFAIRYAAAEPENQDVYMVMPDGAEVLVVADVTTAGVEWVADQMALVDDHDRQQIELVAADLRKRMPVRYSYTHAQAEYQRLANLPLRRCNGTFKTQGAR